MKMQTSQQQAIVVLTNVPDASTAQAIAREIVEKRLAACVNILPAVQSIYHWQGQLESANEVTLLIKTSQALYSTLQTEIQTLHPYEVPEIIALPINCIFLYVLC